MNAGVCSYPYTHGPSICRRCIFQSHTWSARKTPVVRVSSSLHQVPQFVAPAAVQGFINRAEALLYTLADSAVATTAATSTDASTATATEVQKQSGDWFTGITNVLEGFLKSKWKRKRFKHLEDAGRAEGLAFTDSDSFVWRQSRYMNECFRLEPQPP